jgi:hypothetical protein
MNVCYECFTSHTHTHNFVKLVSRGCSPTSGGEEQNRTIKGVLAAQWDRDPLRPSVGGSGSPGIGLEGNGFFFS